MEIFVLVIHVIVSLIMVASILLQSSKSAGLSGAIAGGAEKFFGKKKGIDPLLAKITTISAIVFIITSLTLAFFV